QDQGEAHELRPLDGRGDQRALQQRHPRVAVRVGQGDARRAGAVARRRSGQGGRGGREGAARVLRDGGQGARRGVEGALLCDEGQAVTDSPLRRVHLFPVRHHSPRSSAVLSAFLADVRPRVVLIEGPDDATSLLDVLVDPETRPPVAILGYRTDGKPGSSLWPFASYSPEYVAAKWGAEQGSEVALIDVPIARVLAGRVEELGGRDDEHEDEQEHEDNDEQEHEDDDEDAVDPHEACARARGFRSFEEFWEASFEAPAYDAAAFCAALLGYAELVRAGRRSALHSARDAYMARAILARVAAGVRPEAIVAVVGAAHAAAFVSGDVDLSLADRLPPPVASAATLIPFSFPRLA